jgi:hypothetical protein
MSHCFIEIDFWTKPVYTAPELAELNLNDLGFPRRLSKARANDGLVKPRLNSRVICQLNLNLSLNWSNCQIICTRCDNVSLDSGSGFENTSQG